MANHIYGNHDESRDMASLIQQAGKTGWQVKTFGIGDNPGDQGGYDFTAMVNAGITPIARLNYSHHGEGTIPLPDRYNEFAATCASFVFHSRGCAHWVVGNEPNLKGERPQGVVITPSNYAHCFGLVRNHIKNVNVGHQVITAGIAPYNVDTGDWITYSKQTLEGVGQGGGAEGIGLHAYSRGGDPNSVFSEDKMDAPYQAYYNGFRVYRDFLGTVPPGMRHLPAYLTETDQNQPWVDANNGWVLNAYKEINNWNIAKGTQKIFCLCLYRWDMHDQWEFQSKNGVINDFRNTVSVTDYRIVLPGAVETAPTPPVGAKGDPVVVVVTPAGANLRLGPGTHHKVAGAVIDGTVLPVKGKTSDGGWWLVESPEWGKVWVSNTVVNTENVKNVPVVEVVQPITPTNKELNEEWLITTFARIHHLDETVVRAILAIESGGRGFQDGFMVIRFENHVFHDQIKQRAPQLEGTFRDHFRYGSPPWTGHAVLFPGTTTWNNQHDGGQQEEWQVFRYARTIHERCAMLSISMGMGQIMGGNFVIVGYPTVEAMFEDYSHLTMGKYNQLAGFFAYAYNVKGMMEAIRAKDWRAIARHYNGSGNEDYYAPLLRKKYLELGGKD